MSRKQVPGFSYWRVQEWGKKRKRGVMGLAGYHDQTSKIESEGFPGGAVVKNPPANAGDTSSSPGLGRFHMPWSN